MKKSETAEIIARIISMYPSFKIGGDVEGMEIKNPIRYWHEQIGYMDFKLAEKAVIECINVCKYAPTAAEIIEKYNKLVGDANKDEREIREYYERTRSYYPGSGDYNYGWEEWLTRVSEATDRVSAARWLNNRITQYVNSCEKETMDFAECVRTIGK